MGDQNEDIQELLAGRWERKRGEKVGDVVELYEDTVTGAQKGPGGEVRTAEEGKGDRQTQASPENWRQRPAPKCSSLQPSERDVEVSAGWPGWF